MNKRHPELIVSILVLVLALVACENTTIPGPGMPLVYSQPLLVNNQEKAFAAAQSTLTAGQNEIGDLSHQATLVNLNREQAANAAVQVDLDADQRRLMELSIRGTEISQDMAQAAAAAAVYCGANTNCVECYHAVAQSQAATATYTSYILSVTQTAQVQANLDVRATEAAAYSLTATPRASIQANIARLQDEAEREAQWQAYIVNPIKVILSTLVILLLIAGGVMAYRRLMPVLELRLRTIVYRNETALLIENGEIIDIDSAHRRLARQGVPLLEQSQNQIDQAVQVEIIDSSEAFITHWITEAEQELRLDGRV
jgi:hypothetical protein